jgi:hypothetical protein
MMINFNISEKHLVLLLFISGNNINVLVIDVRRIKKNFMSVVL